MLRPDHIEIARFAPGVKEQVRVKFPEVLFTNIPAEDTTASLEAGLFKLKLHPGLEGTMPLFGLTVASRVIYLPRSINGYVETYNLEEEIDLRQRFMDNTERGNAEQVLEGLDQIEGVRWKIPSTIILARILLNHLQRKEEHLLSREYVWTSDQAAVARSEKRERLIAGYLEETTLNGISMEVTYGERAGIFLVGLPEDVVYRTKLLHSV